MSSSNSSINLVPLDFDSIKSNLKTFLKSQSQFADYDFDGSNMSVLIDLLAYNTFQNAFYMNMSVSEAFLDSAQLKNSVISHAKELNYVPRSSRSAKATVSLVFDSNTNIVTIPKGTSFTTTVGYNLYTFITDTDAVYFSTNNSFNITNVDIYEGQLSDDQFIVNYEDPTQRFVLTDPKIDTRSITVEVVEDNKGIVDKYTPASSTLGLGSNDKVYFLQAAEDGKYEIIFGDNIIGRRPKDSSIVTISYRTCNEDQGNGASRFELDSAFTHFTSTPTITVNDIGRGGAEAESIASIKYYAPRHFQTQERAVNTNDYEIILQQRFPEINAISAYGGEDLSPPQFGKVFIAVDISDVDGLPDAKVYEYSNFIKPRAPLSIDTIFVDPEYLYYSVSSTVKYNVNETNYNSDQVKSLIVNKIITYNDTYLDDFKSLFRYSKFVAEIDSVENAGIISNDTDIRIYKKITPLTGTLVNVEVDFNIPLFDSGAQLSSSYSSDVQTAIRSNNYVLNGERVLVQDDGIGNLRVIKTSGNTNIVVQSNIGTVDYSTGKCKFSNLKVDGYDVGINQLKVYALTEAKDFETKDNVILALESDEINVTTEAVREGSSFAQTRQRA